MKRFVVIAVAVLAAAILALATVGNALSRAVPQSVGAAPSFLDARDVEFMSGSGARIRGWLSMPDAQPQAVALLLPGVRANRLSMVERARFLRQAGYAVLLIDLQATGESEGNRITFGWREQEDVIAAVAFARQAVPRAPVVVIGTSLGGAAALLAAPRLRMDALVVEAVYPTLAEATRNRLRMRLGAAGPLGAPLLLGQLRFRTGVSADELRPIDRISALKCPVFVIGGNRDQHTTPAETLRLFAAAREPKTLWVVPGAAHVDLHRFARAEYEERVLSFLRSSLLMPRNAPSPSVPSVALW